jgi:prepilin-type processing-associated H-X9-DG protein
MLAADGGHQRGVGTKILVKVAEYADGASMLLVDGHVARKVMDSLNAGFWVQVTTPPENVPPLCIHGVNACIANMIFTAIVKTIENKLSLSLEL